MQQNSASCKNCEATLAGPYCQQCGQKDINTPPSMARFLAETAEALTDADSRLWRTLWWLVRYPGELPKRYFTGQRARFLAPLRLYLLISLSFFLLLSFESHVDPTAVPIEIHSAQGDAAGPPSDCDLNYTGLAREYLLPRMVAACEQVMAGDGAELLSRFIANVPTAMFVLMPLFALTMMLYYWRPRRYFIEHLVFQLFNHSAFFLLAGILRLLNLLLPSALVGYADLVIVPYGLYYGITSLRVYYQQSLRLTWFKFLSLMVVYLMLLVTVMLLTGIVSIL